MESFIKILNEFQPYIFLALTAIVIILIILVIALFKSVGKVENKYRKFMRGVNNKNLEELVVGYLDKIDEVKSNSDKLKEAYDNLNKRVKGCIQKISIIRFRAFEDVGSDLSFSIALLDDDNSGVIITSIYGRNESTTYAKPIDRGISRYDLSQEEEQVLEDAMGKRKDE